MKTDDFKHKVRKGFLWLGTGTFFGQLIAWCSTIIVIRLLEPSDYGLMAMSVTFITLLTLLSEFGFGAAIIQTKTITNIQLKQLFGLIILFSVVGWLISYVAAPYISLFYNEQKLTLLVRVIGINFFLIALFVVPQSLLIRDMNFKSKAKVDLSAQVGGSVVTLLMAYNDMGVWSLIGGIIGIHTVKAIGYNIVVSKFFLPSFKFTESIKLAKFGSLLTGDRLLFYIFTQSDKIIVGKVLGDVFLGFYNVALNLASIPAEKIIPIVTQVTFASYSRIQDDLQRINRGILRSVRVMAIVSFPIFYGMAGVAPEAIPLLIGDKWLESIVLFQLVCLTLPLKAISFIFPPAVFAIHKPKVNLVNMMITASVMLISFIIGVQWGLIGLCLAWLIAYPLVFLIVTIRCLKVLGLSAKIVFREILFPFITSVAMLLALYASRYLLHSMHQLQLLMLLIIIGTAIYLILVVVFKKEIFSELLQLVKKT